jgi:hypothetical protein
MFIRRRIPMKSSRLFVFALVFSFSISPAVAQQPIRLQFEVVKNGSTVARPEVLVDLGSASSIAMDGVGRLEFTPTLRDSDLAIAFVVRSGSKQLRPSLVISKREPGYVSWRSDTGAESFKLTVSWVR